MSDEPVILLAGDPGVGKSTIARALAHRLGGSSGGTGSCVRAMAASKGLSLEAFNALLAERPDEDVAIDALAAQRVARGEFAVFESRLAGHLGRWLRNCGRVGAVAIYLRCAPVEQALRLLRREGSLAMREVAAAYLADARFDSLEACASALREGAMGDAAAILERQAARTAADRARMRALYGVELDEKGLYDEVIDTTRASIDGCVVGLERRYAEMRTHHG